MSLTKLSMAGNNVPNSSPGKIWSKIFQESRIIFLQCRAVFLGEGGRGNRSEFSVILLGERGRGIMLNRAQCNIPRRKREKKED